MCRRGQFALGDIGELRAVGPLPFAEAEAAAHGAPPGGEQHHPILETVNQPRHRHLLLFGKRVEAGGAIGQFGDIRQSLPGDGIVLPVRRVDQSKIVLIDVDGETGLHFSHLLRRSKAEACHGVPAGTIKLHDNNPTICNFTSYNITRVRRKRKRRDQTSLLIF